VPEQIIIVSGSQQGLDLSARILIEPGDEVGFENPGYQGARRVFAAYGARLRPLPIDSNGVVVRSLDRKMRLVYVTPSISDWRLDVTGAATGAGRIGEALPSCHRRRRLL